MKFSREGGCRGWISRGACHHGWHWAIKLLKLRASSTSETLFWFQSLIHSTFFVVFSFLWGEIQFKNSIQDWVLTSVYRRSVSAWIKPCSSHFKAVDKDFVFFWCFPFHIYNTQLLTSLTLLHTNTYTTVDTRKLSIVALYTIFS